MIFKCSWFSQQRADQWQRSGCVSVDTLAVGQQTAAHISSACGKSSVIRPAGLLLLVATGNTVEKRPAAADDAFQAASAALEQHFPHQMKQRILLVLEGAAGQDAPDRRTTIPTAPAPVDDRDGTSHSCFPLVITKNP